MEPESSGLVYYKKKEGPNCKLGIDLYPIDSSHAAQPLLASLAAIGPTLVLNAGPSPEYLVFDPFITSHNCFEFQVGCFAGRHRSGIDDGDDTGRNDR